MAQGSVASMARSAEMASPRSEELTRMEAYGKIVSFRDAVLAGSHPTIKLPPHFQVAKLGNDPPPISVSTSPELPSLSPAVAAAANSAAAATANLKGPPPPRQHFNHKHDKATENRQAFLANSAQPAVAPNLPGLGSLSSSLRGGVSAPSSGFAMPIGSARPEGKPVPVEKSDDPIRAERQRIENALKEQLEHHRNASVALVPSESAADLDLGQVHEKALALVKQTAHPSADANVAANKSDRSDSFDEKTFYSSQFDSPNSNHVSRIPDDAASEEDVEMRDESPDYEPPLAALEFAAGGDAQPVAPQPTTNRTSAHPSQHQQQRQQSPLQENLPDNSQAVRPSPYSRPFPILPHAQLIQDAERSNSSAQRTDAGASDFYDSRPSRQVQLISSQESAGASRSGESGRNTDNEQSNEDRFAQARTQAQHTGSSGSNGQTLVRAHDLSPLAPQPSHVSPLATSRQPPMPVATEERPPPRATPAQVSALRSELSAASSPEGSPQAGKAAEKRKGKKKNKRKADRQAADMPYIKAEPRSPSPLSALPTARPHKRLRPSQTVGEELSYDELDGYNNRVPAPGRYRDPYDAAAYRGEQPRVVYERREQGLRDGSASVIPPSAHRFEPEVYEIRRPSTTAQIIRHPQSPSLYPVQYTTGESRPVRSVSHAMVDRPYREVPTVYYSDLRDESRMSVRPVADRERSRSPVMRGTRTPAMAPPPRVQPTRIYIDEYGREYMEPPRPPIVRQSVAPPGRHGEDIIYEAPPSRARAASRMPDPYADSIVYTRASPPTGSAPRRVVTEPEYVSGEYRAYRQREYPGRQQGPGGVEEEYVHGRPPPPPERRMAGEEPRAREYVTRAPSVRPGAQPLPIRYEVARGYGERAVSVRPDQLVREFHAASMHPEVRHEVVHQPLRQYSVRPEAPEAQGYAQRAGSVRPDQQPSVREYHAASVHPEPFREAAQQPRPREYSAHPEAQGAQIIHRPYSVRPHEGQPPYYEHRPVVRGDEEVMFIETRPRGGGEGAGGGGGGGGGLVYSPPSNSNLIYR